MQKKKQIKKKKYYTNTKKFECAELPDAFNKFPDFFVQAFKIVVDS